MNPNEEKYEVSASTLMQIDNMLASLTLTRQNHLVITECMKMLTVNKIVDPIKTPDKAK